MKDNYIVCCKNVDESVKIHKFLFLNGIYWRDTRDVIRSGTRWLWLRISQGQIQACGESYRYLDGYYEHINICDYTFITVDKLMRKLKLQRLNEI